MVFERSIKSVEERDWPAGIKITSELSNLKPLHALWIVDLYKHLSDNQEIIVNGFDSVWISEAETKASAILDKVDNSLREAQKSL